MQRQVLDGFVPYRPELEAIYDKHCWSDKTFPDVFDVIAKRFPDREALVGVGKDQRYTYAELKKLSERLALHFLDMGLQRGDVVALQMTNIPEFGIIWIALNRIGVIPIMLLPQHRYKEVTQICETGRAVGYISCGEARGYNYAELMDQIGEERCMKWKMFAGAHMEGKIPFGYTYINDLLKDPIEERVAAQDLLEAAHPDPHDVCILLLSGGTTGTPKLIPREFNAYIYYATECSREARLNMYTRQLCVAPVAHNFVLAAPGIIGCWVNGGCVVMYDKKNNMEDICQAIQDEKITELPMVPTMIIKLLNFEGRKNYDLSSLDILINGASKLEPSLAVTVKEELDCELCSQFGMSEGTITQTRIDEPDLEVRFATIGLPISAYDEWKILDHDDGHVIAQSGPIGDCFNLPASNQTEVPGELVFRGPYTIRGYFNAPERNVDAFNADGFYKSGDMACLHKTRRGFVIMGRYKDAINRGGEKFSCEEVENACLEQIDWLYDACLIAYPDKILGEKACLFVELKPEFEDKKDELTIEYLNKVLDGHLAKFKIPERIEFGGIMKTNIGKFDKANMKKWLAEKVKAEEAAK